MKNRIMILLCLAALIAPWTAAQEKVPLAELTVEKLFRVKSFLGTTAKQMDFSFGDNYLAFLWNPYDEIGSDLYVYDIPEGKMRQVTSLARMAAFDTPEDHDKFVRKARQKKEEESLRQRQYEAQNDFLAGKAVDLAQFEREQIEKLKLEAAARKADEAKKEKDEQQGDKEGKGKEGEKKEQEKEEWEWRDELKKKNEKEAIKPEDLYPGVTRFVWSKKTDELIMEYRGDLYRYFPTNDRIERLTMTDRSESIVAYTPKGDGYCFRDDKAVYLAHFGSSVLRQLNHQLNPDNKFKIERTSISPDGRWLAIVGAKEDESGSVREIQYMSYKERFAAPKKSKREVSDDKRHQPQYRLYIRPLPTADNFGKEPEPIFSIPGGDVWYEYTNPAWSEEGARYTFATWEREKGVLRVWLGDAAGGKPSVVYENKGPVGHEVIQSIDPRFTPDGKRIVAILDEKGFRRPYLIELPGQKLVDLMPGSFEAFPVVGFSRDSRSMFVVSDKAEPAMSSVFRVDLASGRLDRVGRENGVHRTTALSKKGRFLATIFGNWSQMPELFLVDMAQKRDRILTGSHDPEWRKFQVLVPELFRFKNRHGDELSGLVFKPSGWKPTDARPAIVYVYGGPLGSGHTVEADTYNTSTYLFNMYMAAKYGYVTVAFDPRGQSGFGRSFDDANFENPGRPQVEDTEDLAAFMKEKLGVASGRIGLHGWSFGGFQTQMVLYSSPDLMACGIAGAGPTEWENYNSWYSGSTIGRTVREKPILRKYSLLPLAKYLKKPLLLMHGMEDDNVLYQDTVNVYRSLLEAGKETLVELFVDPDGRHGLGGVVFGKSRFKKYEDWFLKHLGVGN